MGTAVLICLLTALLLMTCIWLLSIPMRRVSIIDAFWGPGFLVITIACYLLRQQQWTSSQWVLAAMVAVWSLRLGWHLGIRCFGEAEEDRRYAAMRQKHDPGFWWKSLGIVFWLQAVIMWMVAMPLQLSLIPKAVGGSAPVLYLAVSIWAVGLIFEAGGDWQLKRFRSDPRNRGMVLNRGLWSLTRHPNYFGDFMVWWGFWLFAWQLGAPVWTITSPLVMSAFLMKFSGAGLLEKDIAERRPQYAEYIRSTNAFFPWPRRRSA
jgi:steroid 5-alpha reductase family enzyme